MRWRRNVRATRRAPAFPHLRHCDIGVVITEFNFVWRGTARISEDRTAESLRNYPTMHFGGVKQAGGSFSRMLVEQIL